jgi:cellulose synthase/poly-beta-1,6-N-acetylglucosamine synthase-like glycosyltransferase/anti-anti-sigma regulatory factor
MQDLISTIAYFSIAATAISYLFDFFFLLIGIAAIHRQKSFFMRHASAANPPTMAVLVPCFNEEKSIVNSIAYLRRIRYPGLQVIMINDGSRDRTLERMARELGLKPVHAKPIGTIQTAKLREIYRSDCGRFIVIDKENGGKADSLNAGINLAETELVTCVDADTLIHENALMRLVAPFIDDSRIVAVGGNVRIKNGSEAVKDFPSRLVAPKKILPRLQAVEYVRSINIARNAFSSLNANLIISGAFGVFKTQLLRELSGYEKMSKGEDFELVMRLHLALLSQGRPYLIGQVYFADAFTDGPESIHELASQRKRWQIGFISTLRAHAGKLLRFPRSPAALFALPYLMFFELLAPLFQLVSYVVLPLLVILRILNLRFLVLAAAAAAFNALINTGFLAVDFHHHSFYSGGEKTKLFGAALCEPFFYHQLNCYWKFAGAVESLRKVFIKAAWRPPRGQNAKEIPRERIAAERINHWDQGLEIGTNHTSLYRERIIIISLVGQFKPADIDRFRTLIAYYRKKNRQRFILEMKELNELSTAALEFIFELNRELKSDNGGLVILQPDQKIRDELRISNAKKEIQVVLHYADAIQELQFR